MVLARVVLGGGGGGGGGGRGRGSETRAFHCEVWYF